MNRVGGALGYSILRTVDIALSVLEWLVIAWVIISWVLFFMSRSSFRWRHRGVYGTFESLNEFFGRALSPVLAPIRKLLPPWKTGGIDWSPMILLLIIFFLRSFLRGLFY